MAVVATAWGRQLTLTSVDDPRLEEFIEEYRNFDTAPEASVACPPLPEGQGGWAAAGSLEADRLGPALGGGPVADDLEPVVERHAVPGEQVQVGGRAADGGVALVVAPLAGEPVGTEPGQPLARVGVGGVEVQRGAAPPNGSAPSSPANRSNSSSTPSTASSASMAPPAASNRWMATSWAMRRANQVPRSGPGPRG